MNWFILCCFVLTVNALKFAELKEKIKPEAAATFRAGAAKVDATPPLGVPLAGYNHGDRRVEFWPLPDPKRYTNWMTGNIGRRSNIWAKATVIDTGTEKFCFTTFEGIGGDGTLARLSWEKAYERGVDLPYEHWTFSASHTHSGPGAIAPVFLWEFAPAIDLAVPELMEALTDQVADAAVAAWNAMKPAKMDIGVGMLTGVTHNRRAKNGNPYLQPGTIDPHLGVFRIEDAATGAPISVIWNYATHGTCYGPDNMKFSGDISGAACEAIEEVIGAPALFINGDAGDIDPDASTCSCSHTADSCTFAGKTKFAAAVKDVWDSLKPSADVQLKLASNYISFGSTDWNITLQRFDNCTTGGELDVCSICEILGCDANLHLGDSWLEEYPRFTGLGFLINGKSTVGVTIPGEALVELGWWIRNDTQALGFDQTLLLGYTNNHLGYFTTPDQYDWGGYESQLTFWGIGTAAKIRAGCKSVAEQVTWSK